jgi:hypothetical protein
MFWVVEVEEWKGIMVSGQERDVFSDACLKVLSPAGPATTCIRDAVNFGANL